MTLVVILHMMGDAFLVSTRWEAPSAATPLVRSVLFGHPEIHDEDSALFAGVSSTDEKVFRFEVAMEDIGGVKLLQAPQQLDADHENSLG